MAGLCREKKWRWRVKEGKLRIKVAGSSKEPRGVSFKARDSYAD